MSREAIEQLSDKWMNDESFREELRRDPEAAIRATGVALEEEEWATVRNADWSVSDEELLTRASKSQVQCMC